MENKSLFEYSTQIDAEFDEIEEAEKISFGCRIMPITQYDWSDFDEIDEQEDIPNIKKSLYAPEHRSNTTG